MKIRIELKRLTKKKNNEEINKTDEEKINEEINNNMVIEGNISKEKNKIIDMKPTENPLKKNNNGKKIFNDFHIQKK